MMKGGPRSVVASSPHRLAIEAALDAGRPERDIAAEYGVSKSAVQRYKASRPPRIAPLVAPVPEAPTNATPKESAQWHCDRIKARMLAAEMSGQVSEREIAALYGQYTNALRHLARLSGSLDITESQVVRSAPFTRVMTVLLDTLRPWPEACKALAGAMSQFNGEGK